MYFYHLYLYNFLIKETTFRIDLTHNMETKYRFSDPLIMIEYSTKDCKLILLYSKKYF